MPYAWKFKQLSGPRKELELTGYNAPFGRPRQKAIYDETIKVRIQTTNYAASKGVPTRHVFGSHWEPMELTGRWMTKAMNGLEGGAPFLARDWIEFVRDERQIQMSWGNVASYTGFIEELSIRRESEHEIAWRMKIAVDKNDDIGMRVTNPTPTKVVELMADVQLFLKKSKKQLDDISPDMSIDLMESLQNLAALANAPSAAFAQIADQIDSFEKATFTTIQKFRNATTGLITSITTMREVVLSTLIDSAVVVRRTEADLKWFRFQLQYDTESMEILSMLREADRLAEVKARSDGSKLVLAKEGDTWESLVLRAGLPLDKANSMRGANGIRFGEKPVPGETYLVPS
jgi:hypothetical protein